MRISLKSYVPEMVLLEGKQQIPPRLCRESMALVDPSDDYRILACRGKHLSEGESLSRLWALSKSELAFLESSLCTHRGAALYGEHGPMLLFSHLLPHTGLLVAVFPDLPSDSLRRALLALHRTDVLCSPALPNPDMVPHAADADAEDQLRELFFYLDRILHPRDDISFWTQTHITAGMVGCPVKSDTLPIRAVSLNDAEQARLSVFLLSLLLRFRRKNGTVSAHVFETDETFFYRLELVSATEAAPISDASRSAPVALPVFRSLLPNEDAESATLELLLEKELRPNALHAEQNPDCILRITLQTSRCA